MDKHLTNIQRIINKAKKWGLKVEKIPWKKEVVVISKGKKSCYFYGSSLPLNNVVAVRLTKYKNLTKWILKKLNVPTPKGFFCQSFEEAREIIKKGEINYPVVVKPNESALGKMVFAEIKNEEELKRAIKIIKENYQDFLLEEYVAGDDFRLLVLDGRVVAVCKRIPPFVIGDGVSSLSKLIEKFNEKREKKLVLDEEVLRNLKKQKVGLNSVIPEGQKIILRRNANVFTGGLVEDYTEKTALFFKKVAVKIVKELGLRIGGVDIITPDITKKSKNYWVTEVNGLPSFDIHEEPNKGKTRDITSLILKAVFKK
ncbi:MAG: hypothetical protein ACPLKP_03070 [Microgenomates group bacterium]